MEVQVNNQPEVEKKIGAWEALVKVLVSPGKVFAGLVEQPKVWLPVIVLMLLALVFTLPFITKYQEYAAFNFDKVIAVSQANAPQGAALAQARQFAVTFSGISAVAGVVLSIFFSSLIAAALLKLLNLVMGEETKFMQIWSVTVFAKVPTVIGVLITNLLLLSASGVHLAQTLLAGVSLATFLPKVGSPLMFSLLSKIQLFGIWSMALTTIGIANLFRSRKFAVGAVIFGAWLVVCVVTAYMGQANVKMLLG